MKTIAAIACLTLFAMPAVADDLADGAAIRTAIADSTVQGSMVASGVYTEFYGADGQIRGDGYQGDWTVDGDRMCFDYGSDPAECWNVRLQGDQVTWVQDGQDLGTGTIVAGNPNGF